MKRLIAILLFAAAVSAQETKQEPAFNMTRDFKNKIFTLQYRDPQAVMRAIRLLGSGFRGAEMSFAEELKTITVRDFPENVAAIEEAIQRLDVASAATPDIEMKISVLIGSKATLGGATLPDELAPVVKQLSATLNYTHYGLMNASVHRTRSGKGIEGSGVTEATLFGMTVDPGRPVFYAYDLDAITVTTTAVDIRNFKFTMRVPVEIANGSFQYQDVGFETPVSLRPNEKVVIGTTTMRDKALIVVVTASVK
jgi:hypothetical protein